MTSVKPAIYQPQAGTLNISGGEVSGYCGIVIRSGTLNISGGAVKGTQNDNGFGSEARDSEGGAYFDGSAIIAIESSSGYAGNIAINITGGTVESLYSYAIRSSASSKVSGAATDAASVSVSGGALISGSASTGVIGGSDGKSVVGSFTFSGGTFDGTNDSDISFLQTNATAAVAKLSTDDDCYYVGADAIEAAIEAQAGADKLTLTVISGDLTLDVDACLNVANTGTGAVTVNGVTIPQQNSDPTEVHILTHVEALDAACTEPGNIEYWYCEACGKYFADAACTVEITEADTVLAATGHTAADAVIENETPVTCTEDGAYDSVVYCTVCGAELSRETIIVPATGHTLTHVEAVAATETTDGNIEYWYCENCGLYFSNEAGTAEIAAADTVIPATGVTPDEPDTTPDEPDATPETAPESTTAAAANAGGSPKTGGGTDLALWFALLCAALTGAGVAGVKKRGAAATHAK